VRTQITLPHQQIGIEKMLNEKLLVAASSVDGETKRLVHSSNHGYMFLYQKRNGVIR
jgi:hypothetical protein